MKNLFQSFVAFTMVAFSAVPAFANRGDATNVAAIRQENLAKGVKLVRIEGALSCDFGNSGNNGQGCELKILENNTGNTFSLIQAQNAMRLYLDGSKSVAIEGTPVDAQTIQVSSAEILAERQPSSERIMSRKP